MTDKYDFIDPLIEKAVENANYCEWYKSFSSDTREKWNSEGEVKLDSLRKQFCRVRNEVTLINSKEKFFAVKKVTSGIVTQFNLAIRGNVLEIILAIWVDGKLVKSGGPSQMILSLLRDERIPPPRVGSSSQALKETSEEISDKLDEIHCGVVTAFQG